MRRGEARCGASLSSATSSPAMRIEPSNPPSSSPTACSRVDLPEPDGPSRATISPRRTSRSTPRSTSMRDLALHEAALEPAHLEHRTAGVVTHSAAPGPDRCLAAFHAGKSVARKVRTSVITTIAATSIGSVLDGSSVRKRTEGSQRFWPGHQLDEVHHRLAEEQEHRAEDHARRRCRARRS